MKNKLSKKHFVILIIGLSLPAVSILHYCFILNQIGQTALIIFGIFFFVSLLSFFSCKSDKQKAINGKWRTPEANLHFLEFIGGWPGSYIAQRLFRHKISKVSYQISFWLIVFIHNFVSADYFNNWGISKVVITAAKSLITQLNKS